MKSILEVESFKQQLLCWADSFGEVVVLDSNVIANEKALYSSYDFIVAVDAFTSLKTDYVNSFKELYQYQNQTKDWLFGTISYDTKNAIESLSSTNQDGLEFPDLFFFQPKKLFLIKGSELEIQYLRMCDDEIESDFEAIQNQNGSDLSTSVSQTKNTIQQRISFEKYLEKTEQFLKAIHRGEIYEANFCMEFFAENADIEPLHVFQRLNAISKAPFAVYYKRNSQYLLSASPERFLKKIGSKLISQPIKGTSKRFSDPVLDEKAKKNLALDPKERSENIMIVDLVRNDMSKTATKGSVQVEEFCEVYSYKQVHQMVSTIVSEVEAHLSSVSVIQSCFPMGSMTGAPKISAMEIIEQLEETKRGLYSGSVGYFTPSGDFDFNVVIRSIMYNELNKYLSFSVGSAITAESIPENEYNECLLKAKAMFDVLEN
ncbi:MAG: anthranilate synthase component I family protein [Flavobacterium sp.]|nr:anthranilate synthase component I family protein [Flavobacterium sp.]